MCRHAHRSCACFHVIGCHGVYLIFILLQRKKYSYPSSFIDRSGIMGNFLLSRKFDDIVWGCILLWVLFWPDPSIDDTMKIV